jgi:hypothetical protein
MSIPKNTQFLQQLFILGIDFTLQPWGASVVTNYKTLDEAEGFT